MIPESIRILIENRFGKKIVYSKDCEALSFSIKKVCYENLSPTTLKRLFGFAKSIDQPRTYTFDVLANYIGCIDWSTLLAKMEQAESFSEERIHLIKLEDQKNKHLLHHQVSISLTTQSINTKSVIELCKKFGKEPEVFPFLTDMISIAAFQKNVTFLSKVFALPNVYNIKTHDPLGYYYIGQTFGLMLRMHKDLSGELLKPLATNINAQKYFIEWFVDEDQLQEYYGQLIDVYYQEAIRTPQRNLFYFSLKYKQAAQKRDTTNQNKWFKKLQRIEITKDFHPIPVGRSIGIQVCEMGSVRYDVSSKLYQTIQTFGFKQEYDQAISFMLYLSKELFNGDRIDWLIPILKEFEKYHGKWELYNRSKNHWGIKIENQLRIYASYTYFVSDNIKRAKLCFGKIDPNLFEPFIYKIIYTDYIKVQEVLKK
jgi:hypothetical protein